ncbi:MAG: hypothetical protein KAU60_01000 [Desulfobacterales bacterium]|nr:hypothetical protein [Desulfobacterales bacterium]
MDDTAFKLGKIVNNLQSLECILRMFLKEANDESSSTQYFNLKVNDEVSEDSFTNYDTLGQLIKKYNAHVSVVDKALCISAEVVPLRDALAHGRVFSTNPNPIHPYLLLKFSKPANGKVKVTYFEEINSDWFDKNIDLTFKQMEVVINGSKALDFNAFKPTIL